MKQLSTVLAFLGLALGTILIGAFGFGRVVYTVLSVGWAGFGVICGWQLLIFLPLGLAWSEIARARGIQRSALFIWGRMVRDASINLLPFSQLGGFFFGARAVMLRGLTWPVATATTVVDLTTEFLSEVVFTGMGLAILLGRDPHTDLRVPLELGLTAAILGAAGFIWLQHGASSLIARISAQIATRGVSGAAQRVALLQTELTGIYRQTGRLALSFLLHLIGWIGTGMGGWIVYHLLGASIDLGAALSIESLVAAMAAASFLVPLSAGIQEAGYAGLGALFGVPPELSLAVSLVRRARDVVVGVPILLVWQGVEVGRLRRVPN